LTVRAGNAKNSRCRNVPLSPIVRDAFAGQGPKSEGFVFAKSNGEKLYQTWLNQQHRAVCEVLKLSKEFTPHCFRHAFGTRLGETGADAFTIMKLMGHSTVTVSQRYVHPSPEGIERAMERLAWFGSRAEVPLNAPQYGVGESAENAQVV
jgi:integrase